MSPHTSCEAELQGSNTVLVQPGYDGGGSTGDMREGDGPGHHPMVLEGEEEERGPLKNKAEFILLLASLAVGTRSVIQYPTLAMRHGGGECQPVPDSGEVSVSQYPALAMRHGGGECQPVPDSFHEARWR